MKKWTQELNASLKPMFLGFLCFLAILLFFTMIYATSQLEPLTGDWQVEINNNEVSEAFPISFFLGNGDEITIKKTIELPPDRDYLTFSVYPSIQGQLLINEQVIAVIQPDEEMKRNLPPYIFLSYKIPEELLEPMIEIEIRATGPQWIYLGYPLMLANTSIIKDSTFRVHFVESYIFILSVGVQMVIVFLMFVIGNSMRSLRKSYLNIGIGALLQAFYLALIILAFNTTLFQGNVYYDYFVPLLMLVSFLFLFQGLEFYILKRMQVTRYFWTALPFVSLLFIFVPGPMDMKHRILVIYFLFMNLYMIFLSIKHTKIRLLQISLFILFFSFLSDFYFRSLFRAFPLPTMQQNAMMILSFVFGSFFTYHFIKNYREEKRLRIELSESLEEVRAVNEELETSYQEIESLNNTLEEKVLERTQELNYTMRDLKMIMDNSEQGFLTLDSRLRVEPTFSKECIKIFKQPLNEAFFPSLIYPNNPEEASFIKKIITAIQKEEDDLKRESYLSLLPDKLIINGFFIELDYKWIEDAIPGEMQLMVIMTDITKRIELENRIEEERNKLSKIIKIMLNLEEFRRMETDYRQFVRFDMKTLLERSPTDETVRLIKRRLHTFKGGFASFGLRWIEKKLHESEDVIQEWSKQSTKSLSHLLNTSILSGKEMCSWLDKEEDIIKKELSDCIPCEKSQIFKEEQFLRIYPAQINTVSKLLKQTVPQTYHDRIDEALSNLQKIKIKEFLNYYRYVVDNIAEKLGKTLNPLLIEGDEVFIDPKKMGKWADTLIHIFRNAIDHGIETTEERIMMNKPQHGQISIHIKEELTQIRIDISDDGRGIDSQYIAQSALEKGFLDHETKGHLHEESLLDYIFLDGFSTKDNVDLISGRGTGLSTVKTEWEQLGGTIRIHSVKNKGTTFIFILEKPN